MKRLVLVTKMKNDYFPESCNSCELVSLYKSEALLHRVFRKVILRFSNPLINVLFSHWIKIAREVDEIIIFDTGNLVQIIKWLREKFPQKRIIVWYWNSVAASVDPKKIKTDDIEIWSFDWNDCEKYGFKYNTQFFIPDNLERIKKSELNTFDVFYVGVDKNRAETLHEFSCIFKKFDISFYFHLVKYNNSQNIYGFKYYDSLSYPEVLQYISDSKVIIDLVADWQEGLTLRPLEALFMKKKLITNMKTIINYDIYNNNNIFIFGEDDIMNIPYFIETPYDETRRDELMDKYSINGWLTRFDKQ